MQLTKLAGQGGSRYWLCDRIAAATSDDPHLGRSLKPSACDTRAVQLPITDGTKITIQSHEYMHFPWLSLAQPSALLAKLQHVSGLIPPFLGHEQNIRYMIIDFTT